MGVDKDTPGDSDGREEREGEPGSHEDVEQRQPPEETKEGRHLHPVSGRTGAE